MTGATILTGDALALLPMLAAGSVQCCISSPPYWGLRDYGHAEQIGLERTPEEYVARLVAVFREVRRILRDDGVLWLNLGDSYAAGGHGGGGSFMEMRGGDGSAASGAWAHRKDKKGWKSAPPGLKAKDLVGVPWMVAFALRADGWWLRSDCIWAKPNPMPESVIDRPTKSHEYVFLLSKSERYFYDTAAIAEPCMGDHPRNATDPEPSAVPGAAFHIGIRRSGNRQRGHSRRHAGFNDRWDAMERAEQCAGARNKRTVWTIATSPFPGAHFAVMPEALAEPCILAGSREGDTVLDPFCGAGTVGVVALKRGRSFIGCELNPAYAAMARERISADAPLLNRVAP